MAVGVRLGSGMGGGGWGEGSHGAVKAYVSEDDGVCLIMWVQDRKGAVTYVIGD